MLGQVYFYSHMLTFLMPSGAKVCFLPDSGGLLKKIKIKIKRVNSDSGQNI